MNDREFLCQLPAGKLHVGDAFYARRLGFSGWLRARTVDRANHAWITGINQDGKTYTVRPSDITRIDRRRAVFTAPDEFKPRLRKAVR